MHTSGTQRVRAILSAFRVKPAATQREIADAAGVNVLYAGIVIRDYLASKAHDQSLCPARKASTADVAVFQPVRRYRGPEGSRTNVNQEKTRCALAENPQEGGEGKMAYCRRIAKIAGVSVGSVHSMTKIIEDEQIGVMARVKEAEEAKHRVEVMPHGVELGPVVRFTGWIDTFARFKALGEAYLTLAQARGDVYARAFLQEIRDISDRAQTRAAKSTTG